MATTTDKPRTLNDCANYRRAWDKLMSIRTEKADLNRQLCGARTALQSLSPKSRARLEAEAMLGGATALPPGEDEHRQTIQDLQHHWQVMAEAEQLQQRILEAERQRASAEICKAAEGEFRALVDGLAVVARQAIPAIKNLREFLTRLEREGIVPSGPVSYQAGFANAEGVEWSLDHWLSEIDTLKAQGVL